MDGHDRNGTGSAESLTPPLMPSQLGALRRADASADHGGYSEPDGLDEAFISPDDPVVREDAPRVPEDFEEVMGRVHPEDLLDPGVTVTGMGDDPHLEVDPGMPHWDDPDLARISGVIHHLAEEIHSRGEAALKIREGMSRFETTLRAFCVGYLSALRDQAPHEPASY